MTADGIDLTGEEDDQCWRGEMLSLLVAAFNLAECCTIATRSSGNANQDMVCLGEPEIYLRAAVETKDRT